MPTLGTIMTVQ